ncbi:MAG: hypothetical protein NUV45_05115 [Tepidanaerobacteraceae bacterium]|jgi:hypothetical protein|nr:hypothetical protein [Tepidanaerobacteraceae bacterium]
MKKLIAAVAIAAICITSVFSVSQGAPQEFRPAAAPLRAGYIEGFLKSKGQNIQIEEYSGRVQVFPLASGAVMEIDGIPALLGDFQPGMEVYAKYSGGSIVYMEGYSTTNPGYLAPGAKVRSGVVGKIDRNQIVLKLATGKQEAYFTSPATIVLKKGENVPLSTLCEGDSVRLFFDEANSTLVSRINIQGESVKIKGVYRGVLQSIDALGGSISLSNAACLNSGEWEETAKVKKIDIAGDFRAFAGGYEIPCENLKYYRGKTVYLAVKDFFGTDKIEKMIIKNQNETAYTGKIEEINWYAGAMELSNKKNIDFNDGTIIVKNGRIVDKYSLNPDSDALVVAEGSGSGNTADLVYVYNEDINNSNIAQNYLYAGRLDEIIEDRVTLRDFYILNKNEWESFDEAKELYYDDDTYIYDAKNNERISRKEFYSEEYAVDESSSYAKRNGLKDWYGYIYADGDRIVAVTAQKTMDSVLNQRVTTGIVETVKEDETLGPMITVSNAADWSARKDSWVPKTVPVKILLEDAVIIKDGKAASWEDIRPQDTVYTVRDDIYGKFVLVK